MRGLVPVLLLALGALSGCHEAAAALGATEGEARLHADELLGAIAVRFGPVRLDPGFASVRQRFLRASLVPSRAFRDASLWGGSGPDRRRAGFWGRRSEDGYRIGLRPEAPPPLLPGDYRGTLDLARLGSGDYEWSMREELAVGGIPAEALSRALTAVLEGAEARLRAAGAGPVDARPLCRKALPRTAAALGRLLALDELTLTPGGGGTTAIALGAALDPAGLDAGFPRYARFLRRNVVPLRFRARVADGTGAAWWDAEGSEGRLAARLRVDGGALVPLEGVPRPLPQALRLRLDLSMRSGLFRVGFHDLEADATLARSAHQRAVSARFPREPDWDLPFLVEPLLRSSLRRPFEQGGALLAFSVSDAAGSPTRIGREYRIAVRESWIVRWLGGVVGSAVEEFRRDAEAEADRFGGEALGALREDVLELLARDEGDAAGEGGAG